MGSITFVLVCDTVSLVFSSWRFESVWRYNRQGSNTRSLSSLRISETKHLGPRPR